ncbi:MAG: hypothetical protein ACRCW0_01980 [Clostridium sp.]
MVDKNKIRYNIDMIKAFTQNGASPNLDEYWNEIVDELSKNIDDTKEYISECSKDEIEFISGYFEDISYNLQSEEFIKFLENIQKKYSNIDIKQEIQWAIDAIED